MKKPRVFSSSFGLLLLGFIWPTWLQAQSMQVFGSNSYAVTCYQDSVAANRVGNARFAELENCNKAIEYGYLTQSDLVATYINRGILYAALGSLSKAASDYARALELNSEVPETYINRGNLWFLASRFEQAISDYDKAQQLELKQMHILHLNRGMAYENMGLLDKAEEDYLASLEVAPEWPMAVDKLERVARKRLELQLNPGPEQKPVSEI